MNAFNTSALSWINAPEHSSITDSEIVIHTSPDTDFWRGTYYGLEYNNAPGIVLTSDEQFWTLKAKAAFSSDTYFDQ